MSVCYLCYLELRFIGYEYGDTCFSLGAVCLEHRFLPFHLEPVFVVAAEMCLRKAARGWLLFSDLTCYPVPFYWRVLSIYISGDYWWMRISYSRSVFCFLVALCLLVSFPCDSVRDLSVLVFCDLFASVSSFLCCVSVLDFFVVIIRFT